MILFGQFLVFIPGLLRFFPGCLHVFGQFLRIALPHKGAECGKAGHQPRNRCDDKADGVCAHGCVQARLRSGRRHSCCCLHAFSRRIRHCGRRIRRSSRGLRGRACNQLCDRPPGILQTVDQALGFFRYPDRRHSRACRPGYRHNDVQVIRNHLQALLGYRKELLGHRLDDLRLHGTPQGFILIFQAVIPDLFQGFHASADIAVSIIDLVQRCNDSHGVILTQRRPGIAGNGKRLLLVLHIGQIIDDAIEHIFRGGLAVLPGRKQFLRPGRERTDVFLDPAIRQGDGKFLHEVVDLVQVIGPGIQAILKDREHLFRGKSRLAPQGAVLRQVVRQFVGLIQAVLGAHDDVVERFLRIQPHIDHQRVHAAEGLIHIHPGKGLIQGHGIFRHLLDLCGVYFPGVLLHQGHSVRDLCNGISISGSVHVVHDGIVPFHLFRGGSDAALQLFGRRIHLQHFGHGILHAAGQQADAFLNRRGSQGAFQDIPEQPRLVRAFRQAVCHIVQAPVIPVRRVCRLLKRCLVLRQLRGGFLDPFCQLFCLIGRLSELQDGAGILLLQLPDRFLLLFYGPVQPVIGSFCLFGGGFCFVRHIVHGVLHIIQRVTNGLRAGLCLLLQVVKVFPDPIRIQADIQFHFMIRHFCLSPPPSGGGRIPSSGHSVLPVLPGCLLFPHPPGRSISSNHSGA